jgi:NADH-quinone oxidoreductase subunit N
MDTLGRAIYETLSGPLALEGGVFGLLVVVLVIGLVARGEAGRMAAGVTLTGLIGLCVIAFTMKSGSSALGGTFVVDDLAVFAKRLFLVSAALSVLAATGLRASSLSRRSSEYHVAILASLLGMLVLASARELVLFFVAFELMSIPLYFLTGFQKQDGRAPEGALKFFLVGSVSSAIVLYGLSFVYGATGSTAMSAIPAPLSAGNTIAMLGLGLMLAGLGFKIAAVPFHMWVPDTYEAAGTPFVAWLSVAPKAAGFVAIFRLYVEGVGEGALVWVPAAAAIASVTILAGNLMAIPQQNIKRLLAYSGIAHIGYLLMGLAAMSVSGVGMMLFYLVAYLFGNMGAFFVVQAVADSEESDTLDAYRGLARRSPVLALSMLLFLLSLGGIPFLAGFWAKLFIFFAVVEKGMYWLAFLGAVATVIALYYYLVVARRMYIDAPVKPEPIRTSPAVLLAIGLCAVGVVVMGAYPQPWVAAALKAAASLF